MSGETGGGLAALPWGEMPYDGKTPREVVDDYALVRGDLVADYARDQLATWIERYAEHRMADRDAALARLRDGWEATHDGVLSPGLRKAVDDLDREWFQKTVERRGREAAALHPDPSTALTGSDYVAAVCVCGRTILRHSDGVKFWHADHSFAPDHDAEPRE